MDCPEVASWKGLWLKKSLVDSSYGCCCIGQIRWDQEMDIKLVGVSTTDKIGSRGLVNSREGFKILLMAPSTGVNGYSYGDYCGSKSKEALCVAHNSVPAVDGTLV